MLSCIASSPLGTRLLAPGQFLWVFRSRARTSPSYQHPSTGHPSTRHSSTRRKCCRSRKSRELYSQMPYCSAYLLQRAIHTALAGDHMDHIDYKPVSNTEITAQPLLIKCIRQEILIQDTKVPACPAHQPLTGEVILFRYPCHRISTRPAPSGNPNQSLGRYAMSP